MFKRQPSMDQAEIDALLAGEVGKSTALRELAQRNAGAVVQRGKEETLFDQATRRYEGRARRSYHVGVVGYPPGLDLPDFAKEVGLLESSRQMEERMRPHVERLRAAGLARFEWFGEPWDSPICHAGGRWRTLPRSTCVGCERGFTPGDQGLVIVRPEPEAPAAFHRKCFPTWMKARHLPLDLAEVLLALDEQQMVYRSYAAGSDRAATARLLDERAKANEPGDAWESPSWEEP